MTVFQAVLMMKVVYMEEENSNVLKELIKRKQKKRRLKLKKKQMSSILTILKHFGLICKDAQSNLKHGLHQHSLDWIILHPLLLQKKILVKHS